MITGVLMCIAVVFLVVRFAASFFEIKETNQSYEFWLKKQNKEKEKEKEKEKR